MAYKTFNKILKKGSSLMKAALDAANKKSMSSTANNDRVTYVSAQKNTNNNYPVRNVMNSMGLDNSKIGWEDGYVTYNNVRFKPSYVKDGVSYASKSDIQNFVNQTYRAQGKNPIRITDYVTPAGMGGISYSSNGMVSAAGTNIPVLYMDGDRAVVNLSDVETAMERARRNANIKTAEELENRWIREYGNKLDNAYNRVNSYGNWSYDPEEDPAYQAYKKMYLREGERAYRDAAAKMSSKNYGNMTSAAHTLANQQLNYYLGQLADRIPELMENSYNRYMSGYDMARQNYRDLLDAAEQSWDRNISINDIAKKDYDNSLENEIDRTNRAIENEKYTFESNQAMINYIWTNAERRGYFTDEEAEMLNIPKKENGEYMTPGEIKINNELKYLYDVEMPRISYEEEQKRKTNELKQQQSLDNSKSLAAYKQSLK